MKIGIIGTGNIATHLLQNINQANAVDGEIIALFGRNEKVGKQLSERYGVEFYSDFQAFVHTPLDVVVEAATVEAAEMYMKEVLESKKDMILSSIGVFKDDEFLMEMKEIAQTNARTISLPSGAIGGLDLLQSANSLGGLREVRITTRKSPQSLGLEAVKAEELLFDGSARKAIDRFPKNINVALLLSIAGIGADQTRVQIIADPDIEQNTHTIEAIGDFGKMALKIENQPMPGNPKTSYLAALSIISALKNRGNALVVG